MADRPRFFWGIPLRGPLSHRLSVSFRTIMIMMVVPAIISMAMMIGFSQLYYSFLNRAERINSLTSVVVDTLPGAWRAVVFLPAPSGGGEAG